MVLQELLTDLQHEGFKDLHIDALRRKIKTIRTVYRQEAAKIEKTQKHATSLEQVYKPRLVWFNIAHSFLRDINVSKTPGTTVAVSIRHF